MKAWLASARNMAQNKKKVLYNNNKIKNKTANCSK